MNRILTSLIGAGLAVTMASGARADIFTIQRTVQPTIITQSGVGGDITVTFTTPTTESPQAEGNPPGTSVTLLNYIVTTSGNPVGQVNFNDNFALEILFRDYSYPGVPTHTSHFTGTISGWASASQDNLVVDLVPDSPADVNFTIGSTPFTISNFMKTLPPIINDVNNPGSISARVTTVPEPGSMALLGTGLLPALGILFRRRR